VLRRGTLAALACTLGFAGLPSDSAAEAGPRFDLDESCWLATHVVVATEGRSIDGHLTVLESWVGALAPGTEVHLPGLAALAPTASRRVYRGTVVTGGRMVLFLRDDVPAGRSARVSAMGDLESACWIEGEDVYAMVARTNVGGNFLASLGRNEEELRARVREVRETKGALTGARTNGDAERRLAVATKHVDADHPRVVHEAFEVIRGCGKVAVPFLLTLLQRDREGRYEERVYGALGAIGDAAAVPALVTRLEEELAFWTEAKEVLPRGWWHGRQMDWDEKKPYSVHIDHVEHSLRALEAIAAPGFEDVVRRTQELWSAAPALHEVGHGLVERACAAALGALEKERRGP
jgi:hypothetical protein